MSEDVFEKPLVMKDFVKEKRKPTVKKSKMYERVKKLPESKRQKRQSRYSELVNAIAKEKRGTYKVILDSIKEALTPTSACPSIEKVFIQIAKRNGVDFSIAMKRQVQTKKGVRTYVSYP
jgi:hypothetical protein